MSQVFASHFAFPAHEQPGSTYDRQRFEGYPTTEYRSPGTSSFHYEGRGWNLSPARSPMSEDQRRGGTPPKAGDAYQSRPENLQKPAREQLPSLSSLFGTPTQSKPAQSSYSERQSPLFSSASPHEARHPPAPIYPDRSFDGGSFQRPSVSSPFSYSSRPDQSQRPKFPPPPPPRPGQPGMGPESPRYESHYSPLEVTRTQPTTSNRWSPSETGRPECFPRDTSSSFKYHPEQLHPKQPQAHRSETEFREATQNTSLPPNYPPTPASTVTNEPVTTKDGLGPKIWTGTQFLPRFVRQAEVPGEGLCYFYDDNTHCKTVIDGEVVNAHWGVTKAGKPRKRLAIACITCREKKIKCDPDYPRCVQCEKFGRVCKFKNAPRGGQGGSPDTPPAEADDIIPRPSSSRTDAEHFELETRSSSHSVSPRTTLRRPTPDEEPQYSKRRRSGYNDFTPVASESSPRVSMTQITSPATPYVEPLSTLSVDHSRSSSFKQSIAIPDQRHVPEFLSLFFRNIRQTGYCVFPEAALTSWILSSGEKTSDDLMLIHTILAVGAAFSSNPDHKAAGAESATIAANATYSHSLSIQLVQSRLLLAIYYATINKTNESWEFCGAAIRAAYALKMNLELEKADSITFPYGLNRSGYAESRRRTFWSCYIMDRLTSSCAGFPSSINSEDVFLRLPCDNNRFESQIESQAPFFSSSEPALYNTNDTTGMMAHLVHVCMILGEITSDIYRSQRRVSPTQSSNMPTASRLRTWSQHLPTAMSLSPGSLANAATSGELGTFMAMHAVYHFAGIKLNRFLQESLSQGLGQVAHYVQAMRQHATDLLDMKKWATDDRSISIQLAGDVNKSSPHLAYAIDAAQQVLT